MITRLLSFKLSLSFLPYLHLLFECSCCKSLGLTYLILPGEIWLHVHLGMNQIKSWIAVEFLLGPVETLIVKLSFIIVFEFPFLNLTVKYCFESLTLLEALLIFVLFLFRKFGFLYLLCQSLTC